MPIEIRMPEFSADLVEADLIDWLVKPGDDVSVGDLIAEFETDKATVEFESPVAGVVLELLVAAGTQGIAVGTLLATLEGDGAEAGADAPSETPAAEAATPETATTHPAEASAPAPAAVQPETDADTAEGDTRASALARRVASQSGVDLNAVAGSGVGGKIVKADVEAKIAPGAGSKVVDETSEAGTDETRGTSAVEGNVTPHSAMRRTIASRLSQAKREIPHFYLDIECRIDDLLATRKQINNGSDDVKLSVNDFVIAATARALRDLPEMNVSWTEEGMVQHESVDVAIAVATDGGLVTPIVRGADRLGLAALSASMRDLAERARTRKLKPAEYQGGSFSISNLGMFGVRSVYAIVNPPHAGILGVGAGEPRPVVLADGQLGVGTLMRCTLSADHRAVDGAVAARWLAAFKQFVEEPLELLL